MPRTRADGQRTRAAILERAAALATVNGLDGLTIGDLADDVGMSKSGLYTHFKSKEALQLATIDEAGRIFNAQVVEPAMEANAGVDQLAAVCDEYFDYLSRRCFPGGCFFAVASLEVGSRPGPVKERVARFVADFLAMLERLAVDAIRLKQLPKTEKPAVLAFELNGIILAAHVHSVLHGDEAALDTARDVAHRRLGVSDSSPERGHR